MISTITFKQLSYTDKKELLIDIFSQINDKNVSFDDTIFLLNVSTQIKDSTLSQIYNDLSNLLQHTKDITKDKYMERLKSIKEKLEQDAEKESVEANILLDNI
jgi:hypothetical protein